MKKRFTTALFSLLLLPGLPIQAEVKALLVGLSTHRLTNIPPLPSVENDLAVFADALQRHCGAKPENIRTLKNDQATSTAVSQAFVDHLINGTAPEDVLVFFYSGHGTQRQEDLPPFDEPDGRDEVLLTWDYENGKPSTVFLDDHMASLLSRVKARHVLVIHDSCHSGTGTRGFSRGGSPLAPGNGGGMKSIDEPFNWTRSAGWMPENDDYSIKDALAPANHLYISACLDQETAGYIMDKKRGKELGILTKALCDVLEDSAKAQLTLDSAQAELRTLAATDFRIAYPTNPATQRPTFESARRDFSLKDYLAGKVFPPGSVPDPAPLPNPSPNLVQAPVAARITPDQPVSGPTASIGAIPVSIAIPEPVQGYLSGQKLEITITPAKSCYLRVYYLAASGNITQLFPNRDMPSRQFAAGENLQLPRRGSELRLGPPKGRSPSEVYQEAIVAVASSREFTDAEEQDFSQGRYHTLPQGTTVGKTISRSIAIEPRTGSLAPASPGAAASGYAVQQFRIVPPPDSK